MQAGMQVASACLPVKEGGLDALLEAQGRVGHILWICQQPVSRIAGEISKLKACSQQFTDNVGQEPSRTMWLPRAFAALSHARSARVSEPAAAQGALCRTAD